MIVLQEAGRKNIYEVIAKVEIGSADGKAAGVYTGDRTVISSKTDACC